MRIILMLCCFLVQSLSWAGELPKPVGKPILTITGNIENTNENGNAVFDIASLEKLGMVSFQTTSPRIMAARSLRVSRCANSWSMWVQRVLS